MIASLTDLHGMKSFWNHFEIILTSLWKEMFPNKKTVLTHIVLFHNPNWSKKIWIDRKKLLKHVSPEKNRFF